MIWAIMGGVMVAFVVGSTIGYCCGRADGETDTARYYEAKRRKWATNEKGGEE